MEYWENPYYRFHPDRHGPHGRGCFYAPGCQCGCHDLPTDDHWDPGEFEAQFKDGARYEHNATKISGKPVLGK